MYMHNLAGYLLGASPHCMLRQMVEVYTDHVVAVPALHAVLQV